MAAGTATAREIEGAAGLRDWLSIVDVPATAEKARLAGLESVAQVMEAQNSLIQELEHGSG